MNQALVIGLGVSGKASSELLLSKGFLVTAADRHFENLKQDIQVSRLIKEGLKLASDDASLPFADFSLAVLSPGIEMSHPFVQETKKAGIEIIGEIELAFRYLPNRKVLGVTGSNGKTTTVLLTSHLLNAVGQKAVALGNVGAALSGYALAPDREEILVVELSSFQLKTLSIKPYFDAAAILNITPNHLNRHASMEEYAGAKLRIGACLKSKAKLFISKQVARDYQIEGGEIFDAAGPLMEDFDKVRLGLPEWINVRAAKALASFCGVLEESIEQALQSFRKPPHRIEWVAEIDGVAYYNDSKASNIEAVMHAVRLFSGPIVLIAGGVDKGSSYTPWIESFRGKVKRIAVYGEAAQKMERELGSDFSVARTGTLKEALAIAAISAVPGDTVLFSPGCSSYDQFANFEQRGDAFKMMVGEEKWIGKRS